MIGEKSLFTSVARKLLVDIGDWNPRAYLCAAGDGEGCYHPDHEAIGKITDIPDWNERANETDDSED